MKITFVIQGPLTSETIKTAEIAKKYGEVIVSCWDNDCPSLTKKLSKHARIVKNKFFKPKGYNFQNIQYQIKTFFEGVRAAKTDYVTHQIISSVGRRKVCLRCLYGVWSL